MQSRVRGREALEQRRCKGEQEEGVMSERPCEGAGAGSEREGGNSTLRRRLRSAAQALEGQEPLAPATRGRRCRCRRRG